MARPLRRLNMLGVGAPGRLCGLASVQGGADRLKAQAVNGAGARKRWQGRFWMWHAAHDRVASMDYSKVISADPAVRSGKPTIRDTRMTVSDVLEYLAGGMSEGEILADFPYLTRDDIRACLAFAAERERRILSAAP